jgi:LPXTG-motif cell wall-anchored protein
MKKKLSFLLALVFVLTLAFGMLPGAGAIVDTDYGTLKVMKAKASGSADISGKTFDIYVHFDNNNDDIQVNASATSAGATYVTYNNGVTGDGDDTVYQWKLTLTEGQYVTFKNINETSNDNNDFRVFETTPTYAGTWQVSYSDSNGDGKSDVNKNEDKILTVSNKYTAPPTYSIIYNENTGTGGPADQTLLINGTYTLIQTPEPTKASDGTYSYSFGGWAAAANGTTPITTVTINNGNKTVYAIWNKTLLPQYGSLTIEKKVTGSGGSLGEYFAITVTFTGSNLGNIAFDVNHTDATVSLQSTTATTASYLISMDHNDNVTFTSIPVGATYVVNETLTPAQIGAGWSKDTSKGTNGIDYGDCGKDIDSKNDSDWVKVWNKYCAPDTGLLKIVKALAPGSSDYGTSPDFTINVKFSGPYLAGIIAPSTGVSNLGNGEYNVTLAIGGSATFTNIPVGVTYVIDELTMPSAAWTKTGISNTDDQVPYNTIDFDDDDDIVTVTNLYTYTPPADTFSVIYDANTGTGGPGEVPGFSDGANPTLLTTPEPTKADEGGFTYSFGGWAATNDEDDTTPITQVTIAGADVTVYAIWDATEIEDQTEEPTETQEPTRETIIIPTSSLTITKTVSGDVADAPADSFSFTATFAPGAPDFWNVLGISAPAEATRTLNADNSVTYTFTLAAGQSITFSNIPVGSSYSVVETTVLANGWTAGIATSASGSIGANGAAATIDNIFTLQEVAGASDDGSANDAGQQVAGDVDTALPQTGGISSSTLLGILGLALLAIGGTAFTIIRKKNDGKNE